MNQDLWSKNINTLRVVDMKNMLKELGGFYYLKDKDEYMKRIQNFKNVL